MRPPRPAGRLVPAPGRRTGELLRAARASKDRVDHGAPGHDPPAVGDLHEATVTASRARQLARQHFRIGEADVAARARDLKHHWCVCSRAKKPPAILPPGAEVRRGGKGTPRRAGDPSTPMA
jgi:hypothetical protein